MYDCLLFFTHITCTIVCLMVAHGRVVTSSPQIAEIKQLWARLVLGWVTGAQVTLPAMCRGVGQAFHYHATSVHPAVMGTWWNEQWTTMNGNSCRKCAEFPPEEMRPYKREFQYHGCKLWSLLNSMGYQPINIHIYIYIYILHLIFHFFKFTAQDRIPYNILKIKFL